MHSKEHLCGIRSTQDNYPHVLSIPALAAYESFVSHLHLLMPRFTCVSFSLSLDYFWPPRKYHNQQNSRIRATSLAAALRTDWIGERRTIEMPIRKEFQ